MLCRYIFTIGIVVTLTFLCGIPAGCSRDEETTINKNILLNEPRKRNTPDTYHRPQSSDGTHVPYVMDEKERKKYIKSAEFCQKRFETCVEQCSDDACEDRCLYDLSVCEQGIPKDLQTLKQE